MPETNLATMPAPGTTAIAVSRDWENQLDLIKRTVAIGLSDEQFALFLHVAKVRHLDPLQRQIHAVVRRTKEGDQWVDKMTIQTGIDGYRAIANRTKTYMPSEKPALVEGAGTEDLRVTVFVKKYDTENKVWHEFNATAYYREFVQTRKDQNGKMVANSMWEKMPINQLTKCAEALALRKGWPEETGGIYVDEEMQHNDSPQYLPPENQPQQKQNKTARDLGTMRPSKEPNRGHGNEGTQRKQEPTICAECRVPNGHAHDCPQNPANKQNAKQGAATGNKKNKRELWDSYEGHDVNKHISFDEFLQLAEIERDLKIKDEDMKLLLDREFAIQHRPHIRKDQFQLVLDTVRKQFDPNYKAKPDSDDGANPELFDRAD